MKLGRLNHIGVATPSIADTSVIASKAKQSRALVGLGSGLPRFARNDGDTAGSGAMMGSGNA